MRNIPLTKGFVAVVDDEDYERVMQHRWYAKEVTGTGVYAARAEYTPEGRVDHYLHRWLLDAPAETLVDHRDLNTLNCCRDNLRLTNKQGNSANREKQKGSYTSKYKGVFWNKFAKSWTAKLTFGGKPVLSRQFKSEEEAAKAYDEAARKYFGEFARLNFGGL